MKIAHFADVHIRNFKYREEYKAAFENLYEQLWALGPDLVINAGDTVHSKLAVSPELFDDVANHMLAVTEIAPYFMILGNHDLNLKNVARTDAISPIVRALQGRTRHQLKLLDPGPHGLFWNGCVLWNYDIRGHEPFKPSDDLINIGLYHGSISGCVTDQGFVMEDGEAELTQFAGMDFVMLGDIHKRQSFRDGRIRYPGSLIQQNYGEEPCKGFLMWDIRSKDDFTVEFHEVKAPHRFFTVQVPSSLDISGIEVPPGSRLKVVVDGGISPSQRIALERRIRDKCLPLEVITPDSSGEVLNKEVPDVDLLIGSRDKLMREHLQKRGCLDVEAVIQLFHQYESLLDLDISGRGTSWKLKGLTWDNMLNYGEGNSIDLKRMKGLVGIFAPNASGKSSIFDVLLQGLFDCVAKDVPRNIDLVNDNRDVGKIGVRFESGGSEFTINRTIERIHYGQRKLTETKQWGKTTLDFTSDDRSLNGTTRSETERAIRSIIGSFEDFALTAMVSQNPVFGLPGGADLINCKETDRRKILSRILDLDVYEKIGALVKNELKTVMGKLKLDRDKLVTRVEELRQQYESHESLLVDQRSKVDSLEIELADVRAKLGTLGDAEQVADLLSTTQQDYDAVSLQLKTLREISSAESTNVELVTAQIAQLEAAKPPTPTVSLVDINSKIKLLRTAVEEQKIDLSRNKSAHSSGMKSLKLLDNIPCGSQFPTCRFIVDAFEFNSQRHERSKVILELEESVAAAISDLSIQEKDAAAHSAIEKWGQSLSKLRLALAKAEKAKADVELKCVKAQQDEADYRRRLDELREQALVLDAGNVKLERAKESRLEQALATSKKAIEDLLRKLGATQAAREQAETSLAEHDALKDSARGLEALAEMCGKNGLPYRILSLVLPLINAEISKILSGIVKFNVFFEDDAEEQTVSLFIRYGDYKSRPLSLGSGAEKFIASLAVRVALLSVTSLPKTDILIVDEGFGKLDQDNLESLQKMFEYLKSSFETVFVVSHVDFMKDIVDHSIEISSQDGYAHVEAL